MSLPFSSSPAAAAATADRQMPPALWAIPQTIQQQPQHHQSRSPPQFKQNRAPRMRVKAYKGKGSNKGGGKGSGAAKAWEDERKDGKAEPRIKGEHVCAGSTGRGRIMRRSAPSHQMQQPTSLEERKELQRLSSRADRGRSLVSCRRRHLPASYGLTWWEVCASRHSTSMVWLTNPPH